MMISMDELPRRIFNLWCTGGGGGDASESSTAAGRCDTSFTGGGSLSSMGSIFATGRIEASQRSGTWCNNERCRACKGAKNHDVSPRDTFVPFSKVR